MSDKKLQCSMSSKRTQKKHARLLKTEAGHLYVAVILSNV